eukprot:scaffold18228_cov92-Amphora_coffeaeformis.AAC.1
MRFSHLELAGMSDIPDRRNTTSTETCDNHQQEEEAAAAWDGIQSRLRHLVLDDCGTEFVAWVCRGLHGASQLTHVTLRVARQNTELPFFCRETWRTFLASLPALQSLTIDGTLQCRMHPAPRASAVSSEHGRLLREGIPPLSQLRSLHM